mmetsp:Transcript_64343/g.121868  ORF Transcript_64343/g.121868 Transcript_64343/m.121868 type:complete len:628 (+) Transcript_64343:111-1994(+)
MAMVIYTFLLRLVCLACVSNGRRMRTSSRSHGQVPMSENVDLPKLFALLCSSQHPNALLSPSGCGVHRPASNMDVLQPPLPGRAAAQFMSGCAPPQQLCGGAGRGSGRSSGGRGNAKRSGRPAKYPISPGNTPPLSKLKKQSAKGIRIAVLGGSLSGLTAVKELLGQMTRIQLSQPLTIDVFRGIYDPVEPELEYGVAKKPYIDYVPEVIHARHPEFANVLSDWEMQGLVAKVPGGKVPLIDMSHSDQGEIEIPDKSDRPQESTFYECVGGAMRLCERLAEDLRNFEIGSVKVNLRDEWIWSATHHADGDQPLKGKCWTLVSGTKEDAEMQQQYDFILLSYDFCYRMHHVKSFRELLDGAQPASEGIMGCFGQLHSAKCIAATFAVDPALPSVPYHATRVEGSKLQWICRPREVDSARWRQGSSSEHWQILSRSSFSKDRFRPKWNKKGAFQELLTEFEKVLNVDLSKHKVRMVSPCYHWDLPAPLNHPTGKLGLIADGVNRIAWTGDFCVEPTTEGCWLAGARTGRILADILSGKSGPDFSKFGPEYLPAWVYHEQRSGDVDLASLTFGAHPKDSAYRGTCNWEAAEKIMQRKLDAGLLNDLDVLYLDHLPKHTQLKFLSDRAANT